MTRADSHQIKALASLLEQDCNVISHPDLNTPFGDFDHALASLLPYHILAGEEPANADLAAVSRERGAELAVSRKELWHVHLCQKALDIQGVIHTLDTRISAAEKALLTKTELPALMLQSYATAEAQAQLQAATRSKTAGTVTASPSGAVQMNQPAPVSGAPGQAAAPQGMLPRHVVGIPAAPVPAAQATTPPSTAAQAPTQPQLQSGGHQPTTAGPITAAGGAMQQPRPAAAPRAAASQAKPGAGPSATQPPAAAATSSNPALAKQQALAALAARIKQSARR